MRHCEIHRKENILFILRKVKSYFIYIYRQVSQNI